MNKKTAFHFVSEMPSMIPFLNRRFFYNDNMEAGRPDSDCSFIQLADNHENVCIVRERLKRDSRTKYSRGAVWENSISFKFDGVIDFGGAIF